MDRELLTSLEQYFLTKRQLTPAEKDMLTRLNAEKDRFPIGYVSRATLMRCGYRTDSISDEGMEEIAGQMGDSYCGSEKYDADLHYACEDYSLEKIPCCPRCGSGFVVLEIGINANQCHSCWQKWSDRYVLVENPEETDLLPDDLGYPSAVAQSSNARYITEYEYIHIFKKDPEPNSYYELVCFPDSQKYMPDENEDGEPEGDSIQALNELINDEKGLEDFGGNAYWVPKCNLK